MWGLRIVSFGFMGIALGLLSCEKSPVGPVWDIPATYTFTREGVSTVDYSGQSQRLDMLAELKAYMQTTQHIDGVVSADRLLAMYANTVGADFMGQFSKDLLSKTFAPDTVHFQTLMQEMAATSALGQEAAPGKAGFLSETYGTSTSPNSQNQGYLVNAKGIEYTQLISKGLMGAVFYYQAMEIYLSADRMGELGNDAPRDGQAYTDMEHYYDEAFGYFGVSPDFPAQTDGIRFWGNYCYERNNGSGTGRFTYPDLNETVMQAWKKGRAAIVAKDYSARDEAIQEIVALWEKIAGATAADYLERSKSSHNPALYKKHHYLSEAIAFTLALKYHFPGGNSKFPRISNPDKIEAALQIVGLDTSLWDLSDSQIDQAIQLLIEAFPTGTLD